MTLTEHIESLDGMVTNRAAVPEIRSQIAFIGREVAALEQAYAKLQHQHEGTLKGNLELSLAYAQEKEQHAKLKAAQTPETPPAPNWGSQPRIKGRMEPPS